MITVLLVLAAILCLFLGILVLSQNTKQRNNILFFFICLCFSVWAVSVLAFLSTDRLDIAFIAAKLFYLAAAVFPVLLLLFAAVFPIGNDLSRIGRIVTIVTGIAMAAVLIFDPGFVTSSVIVHPDGNYVEVEYSSYLVYSIYFLFIFSSGIFFALRKYIRLKGRLRMQAGLYAIGIFLNSVPGVISNLLLPAFGNYDYIWVGPVASVFFLGFATYSIVKHGLFDIRLAAVRTLAYAVSLLTLAAMYYVLAYIVSITLFSGNVSSTFSINPLNILLAIGLAFVFQPIKTFFDKTTDQIFFRDRYNSEDFYARLNEVLTSTTELRGLLQRTAAEIGDTLKSEQGFFFVRYGDDHHMSAGTKDHSFLPVSDIETLDRFVKKNDDKVTVADLLPEHDEIHRLLVSHKIAVLMPLMRRSTIIGYLALGEHRSSGYTNRDIKVLNTISDQLLIAIQNTLSVQEVKDINTHLQQRIDAATKELKTSNAQLRHLDATKDEFLSMASHQLRTPLTSVKGYLSMVLEGDTGKINDMQKHLLGEAFTSSERMVHLIHDFLNVSRLQTGKFMLEAKPVNLAKLIESEIQALKQVADARNMRLELEIENDIPLLKIDETKLQQVVMNYIDNALYYSRPENPVVKIKLNKTDEAVELRVVDGGIGVPKVEQQQLFEKFFRANNARKQRPDGTGVGIYLAKKVINAHGGEIIFESEEGKGSTFGFSLPIKKLEVLDENTN